MAALALAQAPHDAEIRCLLAANCAQLGLRTFALEALDQLDEQSRHDPAVAQLRQAIDGLDEDRIPWNTLVANAERNLEALESRGLFAARVLRDAMNAWRASREKTDWFVYQGGNVLRRDPGEPRFAWTEQLTDQCAIAARFCAERLGGPDLFPAPVAIEGLDPPWLVRGVWARLGPNPVGYAPAITLIQADPAEALDGLAQADLRDVLTDPRVRIFIGPDAAEGWLEDATERLDELCMGMAIATPGLRTRARPDAKAVTSRWSAAHAAAQRRLQAALARAYAGRDERWWAERFERARAGGEPLRVLIPSTRYSTFVRHASEDLAEAFRSLGCEARVGLEKGAGSRPSAVGQLSWASDFEPDLIVLVNYFRGDAGLPFPSEIPWVCWLQDAMAHQFRPRSLGPLDFVVGHIHAEIRNDASFPASRAMPFPVVASTRKFHDGPVDADAADRFACEVAYVSHQSETPGAFHARILSEEPDSAARGVLEALRPLVEAEAAEPMGPSLHGRLRRACERIAEERCPGDAGRAPYLFRHYALPLADRAIRHEMLDWAQTICARRGWRLRVFGRGWERHPALAPAAGGELAHGEALRACYQSAAVHLHASVNTLVHQRVMECALSGGLPVGRLTSDIVQDCLGWAKREAVVGHRPVEKRADGTLAYRVQDCKALREAAPLRRWLGLASPQVQTVTPAQAASFARPDHPAAGGMHAQWLLGDLREMAFRNQAELERLIERAVTDRAWRGARAAEIASRVRERCSTEALARRILALVEAGLAGTERGVSAEPAAA
jgi:hypothetical protein